MLKQPNPSCNLSKFYLTSVVCMRLQTRGILKNNQMVLYYQWDFITLSSFWVQASGAESLLPHVDTGDCKEKTGCCFAVKNGCNK